MKTPTTYMAAVRQQTRKEWIVAILIAVAVLAVAFIGGRITA